MTHPLSPAAVEAGAIAIETQLRTHGVLWKSLDITKLTINALSAAFEQSRLEGNAKDGVGLQPYEPSHNYWDVYVSNSMPVGLEFPVIIIRKAKP